MSTASNNLRDNQEQADRDGVMVKVSRQAVDETLAEYAAMLKALQLVRHELVESGNWNAKDFGWPKACAAMDEANATYVSP